VKNTPPTTLITIALCYFFTVPTFAITGHSCEDQLTGGWDSSSASQIVQHFSSNTSYVDILSPTSFNWHHIHFENKDFEEALTLLPAHLQKNFSLAGELRAKLRHFLKEALNPYSVSGVLNDKVFENKFSKKIVHKLALFAIYSVGTFNDQKLHKDDIAKKIFNWVRSPEEALFAYQHIEDFGDNAEAVFSYLLKSNLYFASARIVLGPRRTLQTFAFEKETPFENEMVGFMWRLPGISEEDWFEIDPAERRKLLQNAVENLTVPVPTKLAITRFSRLKKELLGAFEFVHPSYEFDLQTIRQIALKIVKEMKESHSFHFHQVFDLKKTGTEIVKYKMWLKLRDDRALLLGMESGVLPTSYTNIRPVPSANVYLSSEKTHTLGQRFGSIYEQSKDETYSKVGIETRDALRDIDKLFDLIIEPNADDIDRRIWNKQGTPSSDEVETYDLMVLHPASISENSFDNFCSKVSETFCGLVRTTGGALIPFQNFDKTYYSYRENFYYQIPKAQIDRLEAAQEYYVNELLKIYANYQNLQDTNIDTDLVKGAIRMSMSEWAQLARVSEFYRL